MIVYARENVLNKIQFECYKLIKKKIKTVIIFYE